MLFTYSEWEKFCRKLSENNIQSITAASILDLALQGTPISSRYVNIKHDVESVPSKALDLARIEAKYGHCATYYVQAYLLTDSNKDILKEIQSLGHEVTYHHDVMDCAKGDIQIAMTIYKENVAKFEQFGFPVVTVCQHGNPSSKYENRDFFRSDLIQEHFPSQSDIMVDFMIKAKSQYTYISDVGMEFKIVTDPVNSDKLKDDEKYIVLGDAMHVIEHIITHPDNSYIVSAHPHRYNKNRLSAALRKMLFQMLKGVAKVLFKLPGLKNFVFRFKTITKHL